MKELLYARYRDLITRIAAADHQIREGLELYKANLLLVDGSSLRVSEVWIDGALKKYSYYWLDESDHLIAGWDNAPHHPEIKTHPHHRHSADGQHTSSIRRLEDVLQLLSEQIMS
jgi:hypothetical protein